MELLWALQDRKDEKQIGRENEELAKALILLGIIVGTLYMLLLGLFSAVANYSLHIVRQLPIKIINLRYLFI